MYTSFRLMKYQVEVKKDLVKVLSLLALIAVVLTAIKMYDAKTNEVGKVGEKILKTYVN